MRNLSARPLLDTKTDAALYVGRETELNRGLDGVERQFNTLVLGSRGSGKTSFLHRVAREARLRGSRVIFLEGALAQNEQEVLELFRWRLGAAPQPLQAAMEAFQPRRPQLAVPSTLLRCIEDIARTLSDSTERVLVLLDDIPNVATARQLFGNHRDLLWQLPLVWVVAGDVGHKASYLDKPADVFFEQVVTLSALPTEEALQLLRSRAPRREASDALLRQVIEAADGHPRALLELLRAALVEGADPGQLGVARSRLAEMAGALGEPAVRVVEDLAANGPVSASDEEFLRRMDWTRSRAVQVFRKLEDAGLVRSSRLQTETGSIRKVYELTEHRDGA
jgi:hypothetical protein